MASPNLWPNGFNLTGTVFSGGPTVAQLTSAYLSGTVQWLDTVSGSNANAGTNPEQPVQTLAQAVTNSAANGLIVIGYTSAETLAATQTLNVAGLTIFGCGAGTSRPRYTLGTNNIMLDATAAGTRIYNMYFPAASTGGASSGRVRLGAASCMVKDCYFECGTNDTGGGALQCIAGSTSARVEGCTFIVTASRPTIGFAISAAVSDIELKNCIFDGGSYGWSDPYAAKVSAAATRMWVEAVTMRNQSDWGVTITGTSYRCFGLINEGTSQALFTA